MSVNVQDRESAEIVSTPNATELNKQMINIFTYSSEKFLPSINKQVWSISGYGSIVHLVGWVHDCDGLTYYDVTKFSFFRVSCNRQVEFMPI